MSWILQLLITQQIISSVCVLPAPMTMMQDDNFISEIGDLFGRALRRLADDPQEPAAPAMIRAFDAADQRLTPRQADRKEHAVRTRALAGAVQAWVTQTCQLNQMQQGQVEVIFTKALETEAERYANSNDNQRENRPFGEATPILFVQPKSVGAKLSLVLINAIRDAVLSETQNEQLSVALAERVDFQRAAFREYVVALADQELFLTEDQRSRMLELLQANTKPITSPFYAFVAQPHYLPYQPISGILKQRTADFLDERQLERLNDLTSNNGNGNQNHIMFQASEGPEQWQETVRRAVVSQRTIYLHATAVRIGYLERTLKLTPEQVAYLTVASKGAATDALFDWKEATQNTINQMQEQMGRNGGQNFAFSSQNISIDGLDNNKIWTSALRRINPGKKPEDRGGFIRRAKAGSVTALLDQELWLMPQQRAMVFDFTEAAIPRNNSLSPWDQYVRELLLLAYPLHKVTEANVKDVFSESQQTVWKQLKDFFRWNIGNNYVEIPLKNQGGGFQVQLNE